MTTGRPAPTPMQPTIGSKTQRRKAYKQKAVWPSGKRAGKLSRRIAAWERLTDKRGTCCPGSMKK